MHGQINTVWGQRACMGTHTLHHACVRDCKDRRAHGEIDMQNAHAHRASKGCGRPGPEERERRYTSSLVWPTSLAISWAHQKGIPVCMCVYKHMCMSAKTLRPTSSHSPHSLKFGATSDKHSVPKKNSVPTETGLECKRHDHDMGAWGNDRQIGRQKNIRPWRAAWTR